MLTGMCGLCHCQRITEKEEGSSAHGSDQEPSYVLGAGLRRR